MSIPALQEEITDLIAKRHDAEHEIANQTLQMVMKLNEIAGIEHDAWKEVIRAQDDGGRPLYSNETARKVAQEEIVRTNKHWQDLSADVRLHRFTIATFEADVKKYRELIILYQTILKS